MAYSTITPFVFDEQNIDFKFRQYSDNMRSLRYFNDHGVDLSLSDDVDVTDSAYREIDWDVEDSQVGGIWTSAEPERLYAPVDGIYIVILNVEWRTSSGGERTIGFEFSFGPTQFDLQSQGAILGGGNQSTMRMIGMSAGQHLVMNVYQSSGGTIGIRGNGKDRTSVSMWLKGV